MENKNEWLFNPTITRHKSFFRLVSIPYMQYIQSKRRQQGYTASRMSDGMFLLNIMRFVLWYWTALLEHFGRCRSNEDVGNDGDGGGGGKSSSDIFTGGMAFIPPPTTWHDEIIRWYVCIIFTLAQAESSRGKPMRVYMCVLADDADAAAAAAIIVILINVLSS